MEGDDDDEDDDGDMTQFSSFPAMKSDDKGGRSAFKLLFFWGQKSTHHLGTNRAVGVIGKGRG